MALQEKENKNSNIFNTVYLVLLISILLLVALLVIRSIPAQKWDSIFDTKFNYNLKTMKEAAKSYYTTDRLPKESEKLTLQDMLDKNLLIPFIDKNGDSCDMNESYVQITKVDNTKYTLKVTLKCGDERDFVEETIGCYDLCEDNSCKEVCATEYQYKKWNPESTKLVCPSGYTASGDKCYKIVGGEKIAATKVTTSSYKYVDAKITTSTSCSYTDTTELINGKCYNPNTVSKTQFIDATCQKFSIYNTPPQEYKNSAGHLIIYDVKQEIGECTGCVYNRYYYEVCKYNSITMKCPEGYSEFNGKCYSNTTKNPKTDTSYSCSEGTPVGDKCKIDTSVTDYVCTSGYLQSGEYCIKNGTKEWKDKIKKTVAGSYSYKWSSETTLAGWEKTSETRSECTTK